MNWTPPKTALLLAALALTACGGGGGSDTTTKVAYTKLVSFGDSLSDVGTYKVGAVAALGGGKFTVNGTTTGPVNWTELLAAQLSLPAPCAAQTGLLSNIPQIPLVPVANATTCTNYAQGSSRVTSAFGPNSVALQALGQTNIGLMAVPLATQFSSHVAAHGNYSGTELVTVMAGANDVFMYVGNVLAAAASSATALENATLNAEALLKADATALVSNIQTQVLDKGAKYVVLVNVPSIEKTPFGQSTGVAGAAALKRMVEAFNTTLQTKMGGMAKVVVVDAYAQSLDQYQNPAQYGLKNIAVQACGANALGTSSLACTPANVTAGVDIATSLFADDVHPTPFGYQLLNRFVALKMAQAGWL